MDRLTEEENTAKDFSRCVDSIQVKLVDSTAELQQKAACQINNNSSVANIY